MAGTKKTPKVPKAKAGKGRKLVSEARNPQKPISFVVEFECEERRQFELSPEALHLLEANGLIEDVCESMALIRPEWKERNRPRSSGSVFGLGGGFSEKE
jgi:hypothetical protein